MLRTLLSGFDYDAMAKRGPGVICRALAAVLAEVEDLQRRHLARASAVESPRS